MFGRKKKESPVQYNYYFTEVDYKKIQEAFYLAQKQIEKENNASGLTTKIFSYLNSALLMGVGLFSAFVAILTVIIGAILIKQVLEYCTLNILWEYLIAILLGVLLLAIFVTLSTFSVLIIRASKEMEKIKDTNYILAVFSGVTGLLALVFSFIALLQGVA